MKNEPYHLINEYFHSGVKMFLPKFCCITCEELQYVLSHLRPYEAPDLYVVTEDKIIILEHFEFDASRSTRKGMDGKKAEAELNKRIRQNDIKNEWLIDMAEYSLSFENWQKNFEFNFEVHQRKINSYINNIQNYLDDREKTVVVGFIAENQYSPFVHYNQKVFELPYFHTKQFVDFFARTEKVDFIIFVGFQSGEPIIACFDRNSMELKSHLDLTDKSLALSHLNKNEVVMYASFDE